MPYTLESFCAECHAALRADPGKGGREKVRGIVEKALRDKDFVAAYLGPQAPVGRRTLYQDAELDFVVLGYVENVPHRSPPHDHGHSWAVYGQAEAWTEMTEYRRLDGGDGGGPAELQETSRYRLEPGQAGLYDGSEIHAIDYPAGARFLRVTGTDLEHATRLRYDEAAGRAVVIESASAS